MNGPVALGTAATAPAAEAGAVVSVKRGFGWSLTAYAVYMGCMWAIMAILARWGKPDLTDVALFAMALATSTPVILFFNLGLRRVYATDATGVHRFSDYFTLRMVTNFGALAVIAAVVWLRDYRSELVWTTLALAAAKMIESISDVLHGFFQERRRIDVSSRATIMRGILSLGGFIAGFAATGQVFWGVIGMGAGWAAVLLFYEWPQATRFLRASVREAAPVSLRPRRANGWLRLAVTTLPLGVVALVTALKGSIPTFVIESNLGETALGIFAALIYFHHGINRVVSSLGEAAAARLASLYASRNHAAVTRLIVRMVGVTVAISLVGIGVAWAAGNPLLRLLYGPIYAGFGDLLLLIMVAALVANVQQILDYAMMAVRRFRIQPYLYGGGAGLLVLLSAAFVPSMGLKGAVLALGIVSAAELLAAAAVIGWALIELRSPRLQPIPEAR